MEFKTYSFYKIRVISTAPKFLSPKCTKAVQCSEAWISKHCKGEVLKTLEKITYDCITCQNKSVPHRFKVSIPPGEIVFNAVVALDIM